MVNNVAFSKRLKQLIDHYELTASSFSDIIDFNRSTISHLLSGRNKPSLDFVLKLIKNFPEVSIEWLVEGKGEFPKSQEKFDFDEEQEALPEPDKSETLDQRAVYTDTPSLDPKSALKTLDLNSPKKEIARVIVFYTDYSFEAYEN